MERHKHNQSTQSNAPQVSLNDIASGGDKHENYRSCGLTTMDFRN